MVVRANTNLTNLSNTQLKAIVIAAVAHGVSFADIEKYASECYITARKDVKYAACAIDLYIGLKTVVIVSKPSPEAKQWSNMEGGHRHHEKPSDKDVIGALFR